MAVREALLDPTGVDERTTDDTLAPRPESIRGLTIGLLDNTKVNATQLLQEIGDVLTSRYGVGSTRMYTKDYFGTPVKEELLRTVAEECDVVVTAVGDCGSCSAATVADGVHFERAGIPAVSICSDSFRMSGAAMARMEGFPGFEFLTVEHPVASLDAEQIRQRAEKVIPDIVRILGAEA